MTRRIVRTIIQVTTLAIFTFLVMFLLDRNFRVLPSAIHEYLPSHHAGLLITDLTITQCSTLNIFSSCKLDPDVWHRIDKDLYLGKAHFSSAYLHIRRKKEGELTADDSILVDVTVGRLDPANSDKGQDGDLWEARPAGLWIKRTKRRRASDSEAAVTAIDVLFGEDAVEAREGWAITGTPLLLDVSSRIPVAHLTVRRGSHKEPFRPQPRVNENGRFKIVQLADLHLSTGVGVCRDSLPEDWNGGRCEADPRTLDFVEKVLEDEKPDLVVLSGDQVNGDTAPDAQTAIFKYAQILINRKIPYATIFGNHDDEGSLPRSAQMDLVQSLPYSLSRPGPKDIDGVGNYYIEVLARGSSGHSALTLYLLDTHAYSPDERKFKGYDWIKQNQIDWFRDTAQRLKRARNHKDYTHVHMDAAFIHIPLPEYRTGGMLYVGPWREPSTAPVHNSGFRDTLVEEGVVMVSCGHDHVNEYCGLSTHEPTEEGSEERKPALWMCYAGGTGFGGYAGYGGFHRKIRVFDFDLNEGRITTWKRVEWGEEEGETERHIDEQILVDAGRPIAPMIEEYPPPEEGKEGEGQGGSGEGPPAANQVEQQQQHRHQDSAAVPVQDAQQVGEAMAAPGRWRG